MELAAYLDRIRFEGPVTIDLAGLCALHRAHLTAISYENLDLQLARPRRPSWTVWWIATGSMSACRITPLAGASSAPTRSPTTLA